MGTEKRERQKANRAAKRAEVEAEQTKEHREESTKKFGKIAIVVAGLIAVFFLYSVLTGGDDSSSSASFVPTPVPEGEPTPVPEVVLLDEVPSDFVPFAGEGVLASVKPEARNAAYDEAPPMTIDATRDYAAVIETSVGSLRFTLFADEAPLAVNSFVNLARDGFYDGLNFHRILPGFMAQGGDPAGNGSGGPGYTFDDEFDSGRLFDSTGQLALANAGPATNGSQFFITFNETGSSHLNGVHTIFGEIVGTETPLGQIAEAANGDIVIESIRVLEG